MFKSRNFLTVIVVAIISLLAVCLTLTNLNFYAVADESLDEQQIMALCKQLTEDEILRDETKNESMNLDDYPNYVSQRFDTLNLHNPNENTFDEWITKIVPVQLFEQEMVDFLFIGSSYGFYFNFEESDDTYLIYLFKHSINNDVSGQLVREIQPFYYEKYKLNEDNNLSILYYYDSYNGYYYFREYNRVKKLYLKDVSFSGSLYNQFHLNQGEDSYIDANDLGGFFVGNRYLFSGVSTQTGKSEFSADVLRTTVGYIPYVGDYIGLALDIYDIVDGLVDEIESVSNDYRVIRSNASDYDVQLDEMYAPAQIEKYGHILKDSYSYIKTPNNENAVLLGINNNCYAQNTFYINYANHYNRWDTLFAGQITLDIVEEEIADSFHDSTINELKTRVTSNDFYYNLDNNEEFEINENELLNLYILGDAELKLNFVAPVNCTYTFTCNSAKELELAALNQNIEYIEANKKIAATLTMNEKCRLKIKSKNGKGVCRLNIDCKFTPEKVNLNMPVQRSIKPNQTEYLLIMADSGSPFDFAIRSNKAIEAGLYADNREQIVGNLLNGTLVEFSYYLNGNRYYYLAIHNYSSTETIATIELKNVKTLNMNGQNTYEISDEKFFKFSPMVSSEYKFSYISSGVFKIEIYNENNNYLAGTIDANNEFSYLVEKGHAYTVLVKNISHAVNNVNILVNLNPVELKFGGNEIYQITRESCYKLTPKMTANYSISSTNNSFTVYDSQWNTINKINSGYNLIEKENYFIVVNGSTQRFTLNVELYYTTQESGLISSSGEVIVKFIPNKSVKYVVDGAEEVEWFDSYLNKVGSYLTEGSTYFVKIKGQSGTSYEIKQGKEYTKIYVNRLVNLYDGSYTFTIESAGKYGIMFYCGKNTVDFTLYDDNGKEIYTYNKGSGNFQLELSAGVYTFELSVSDATTVGIKVVPR